MTRINDLTGNIILYAQTRIAAAKDGGGRPSVPEAHYQNVSKAMSSLRTLGHVVTGAEHTDPRKMPTGMARSVIHHSSGKNRFKTTVRTAFNNEGGNHIVKQVTEPDTDGKKPAVKEPVPEQTDADTQEQTQGAEGEE